MIILESLRIRPIGGVLDPTIARAIKIDAIFSDSPKPKELAWIDPDLFTKVTGVNYKDRAALNQFAIQLGQQRLNNTETRSEASRILEEMGLVSKMNRNKAGLTKRDHANMNAFLGHVLNDCKDGTITIEQAVSGVAHVLTSLDKDNYAEVRNWLERGRKLIQIEKVILPEDL